MAVTKKTQVIPMIVQFTEQGAAQILATVEALKVSAKDAGKVLSQGLLDSSEDINRILTEILTHGLEGTGAKNAIKDAYKSLFQETTSLQNQEIFGKQQLQDAKNRISELRKEITNLGKELKGLDTLTGQNAVWNEQQKRGQPFGERFGKQYEDLFNIRGEHGAKALGLTFTKEDFQDLEKAKNILEELKLITDKLNVNQQKFVGRLAEKTQLTADTIGKRKNQIETDIAGKQSEKTALSKEVKEYESNQAAYDNYAEWLERIKNVLEQLQKQTGTGERVSVPKGNEEAASKFSDTVADVVDNTKKLTEVEQQSEQTADRLVRRYTGLYMVYRILRSTIQQVISVTKELDSAFNEIAIVSTYSTKEVWNMYDQFLTIANATGTKSSEIIKVAGQYFRQGKSLTETLKLTEAAAMSARVAGIDASESVRYLTAALNGYNLSADQALEVSDKFSKLAASAATTYEDLAIALGKVAAQASASGVGMDSLLGFMTRALEVTQEAPENIGTAFKTIFARMGEIKDYGATLEDNVNANKVSKALDSIGVALFDTTGQMRNLDEVLIDVGYKWNNLDTIQQKYVATALAGTRQQTRLISIFQDFDKTMSYVEKSANSIGATLAQQAKYTESLEYSLSKLNNAWEEFVKNLGGSNFLKGIVDILTDIVNLAAPASKLITGLGIGFLITTGVGSIKDAEGVLGKFIKTVGSNFSTGFKTLTNWIPEVIAKVMNYSVAVKGVTDSVQKAALANEIFGKSLIALKVVGIVAAIAAVVAIIDALTVSVNEAKENIQRLNAEIYNTKERKTKTEDLIEEYKKLSAQIIKTTEDYQRMEDLRSQIEENAGKGIFNIAGEINEESLKSWLKEQDDIVKRNLLEESKNLSKSGMGLYGAMYGEKADENTKSAAHQIATIQILTGEYEDMASAIETYYTKVNQFSSEETKRADALADAFTKLDRVITRNVQRQDSGTGIINEQISYSLDDKLQGYNLTNEQLKNYIKNGGGDLGSLFEQSYQELSDNLQEYTTPVLNALAMANDDIGAAINIFKTSLADNLNDALNIVQSYGPSFVKAMKVIDPSQYLTKEQLESSDEMAKFYENLAKAQQGIEDIETAHTIEGQEALTRAIMDAGISAENVIPVMRKLRETYLGINPDIINNSAISAKKEIDDLNSSINDGRVTWQEIFELLQAYPEYNDEIIKSITEQGEVSDDLKQKLLSNYKEQYLTQLKYSAEEDRAEAEHYEAAAQAMVEFAKAEYSIRERDLEDAINKQDTEYTAYAERLSAQLELEQWFVDNKEKIQNKEYVNTKEIYDKINAARSTITNRPDSNLRQDALDQAERYLLMAKNAWQSYDAKMALINGIKNGNLDLFGGLNNANKNAKEYIAKLNEIYNAERRLQKISSALSLNDALSNLYKDRDGASYRFLIKERIKLLEQQQDATRNLINVTREEQALYMANVSAQTRAAIVIDELGYATIDFSKVTKENVEELETAVKQFNDYTDSVYKNEEAILKDEDAIKKINEELRDQTIKYQNLLRDAFIKYYQDVYQTQIDYLEKEKELLDKRKQMYQDAFAEEDYQNELDDIAAQREKIISELGLLEGATDSKSREKRKTLLEKLEELNKNYNDKVVDYNRESLTKQMDDQQQAIDQQQAALEEAMNDIPNQVEKLEKAIEDLTEQGSEAVIDFLRKWGENWSTALSLERAKIEDEWQYLYDSLFSENVVSRAEDFYNNLLQANSKATSQMLSNIQQVRNAQNELNKTPTPKPEDNSKKYSWTSPINGIKYLVTPDDKVLYNINTPTVSDEQWENWYTKGLLPKFSEGGYAPYTGLAMLHGTQTSPEAVLNPQQTAMFENLTASLEKMYNNNSMSTGSIGNITIEGISISTNALNNSQDFYNSGVRLGEGLQDILRQKGIVTNLK